MVEVRDYELNPSHIIDWKIKVDSHNTIPIHPIKDSWNRDEVVALLRQVRKDTYNGYSLNKWIEENL